MPKKPNKKGVNKNRTSSNKQEYKIIEETKENKPEPVQLTTGLVMKCILDFFDLHQKKKKIMSTYICNEVPRMPKLPSKPYDIYYKSKGEIINTKRY